MGNSYRDLIVWQKAMDLVVLVYQLTDKYPKQEIYILVTQMRRCVISIVSNIAEGRRRGSRKDFHQFLQVSYASGAELETQLEISMRLGYCSDAEYQTVTNLLEEVMRILNTMLGKL